MKDRVTTAPTTVPHPSSSRLHSLLIKHSNAMNYWGEAAAVNGILLLCFYWWGKKLAMCAGTNSLSSLCTQHGRRLISHSNISVGNGKMAEMHAEATPFFLRATERQTLAPLTGKMWHFLHCDTLHLQIDALSEIDRRRRNECASVTQRCATRTLWDLSSGVFWLVCFLKHRGPAVYVIQI